MGDLSWETKEDKSYFKVSIIKVTLISDLKNHLFQDLVGLFMVFNATFNKISVISWESVLLVEETRVPGEKPLTCRRSLTNPVLNQIVLRESFNLTSQ
jgi:hypothetical protein